MPKTAEIKVNSEKTRPPSSHFQDQWKGNVPTGACRATSATAGNLNRTEYTSTASRMGGGRGEETPVEGVGDGGGCYETGADEDHSISTTFSAKREDTRPFFLNFDPPAILWDACVIGTPTF